MVPFVTLLEEWGRFDQAAFESECRVHRELDGYCEGLRAAPALSDQAAARRQRYIAQHRLRWILFQIGQRRDGVPRI